MYKHTTIRLFFLFILLLLFLVDWRYELPWYTYLAVVVIYLLAAFFGSYFIQFNYFLHSYCHGSRNKKEIAITFDDGPFSNFTPQVLDILNREKVPVAFFLIGKNISGNEAVVNRMVAEGHLIGNHSYRHGFWFSLQNIKAMNEDLQLCDEEIKKVTGLQPQLFRPPYGVTNPGIAKVIQQRNYHSIGWSIRTYDTGAKSAEALLNKSLKNLSSGDVVLFHDWGPYTIGILSDFIKQAHALGFKIVRIDELFGIKAYHS
ncbi:MAG: polysaccharide deacetylase family protein [Chitinophagales bacterium]